VTASSAPVRIGILGAARIAPSALIRPAREVPEARVVAVAARDKKRAEKFAARHGVERAFGSYEELLADPGIDAIYNPLPNSLHARWTVAALAQGKHVLCEKPFTSNAAEAVEVEAAAARANRVVMEAFHCRYHPLMERMRSVIANELGPVKRVETWVCFPLPFFGNIRYRYDLGGGAQMDAGCYAVHVARVLAGAEPRVTSARATLHNPDVDRAMSAELAFPNGAIGRTTCSLWSSTVLKVSAHVEAERGTLDVFNPIAPQVWHRLTVRTGGRKRSERVPGRASYTHQLEAFCSAILHGTANLTPPSEAVANMRVVDAIYTAAGMKLRGMG
jgi:predicted dehydrogenase